MLDQLVEPPPGCPVPVTQYITNYVRNDIVLTGTIQHCTNLQCYLFIMFDSLSTKNPKTKLVLSTFHEYSVETIDNKADVAKCIQEYGQSRPLNDAATTSSNCLFKNPNEGRRHAISSLSFDTAMLHFFLLQRGG